MVSIHQCPICQADMYIVYNRERQLVYICSCCSHREEVRSLFV